MPRSVNSRAGEGRLGTTAATPAQERGNCLHEPRACVQHSTPRSGPSRRTDGRASKHVHAHTLLMGQEGIRLPQLRTGIKPQARRALARQFQEAQVHGPETPAPPPNEPATRRRDAAEGAPLPSSSTDRLRTGGHLAQGHRVCRLHLREGTLHPTCPTTAFLSCKGSALPLALHTHLPRSTAVANCG